MVAPSVSNVGDSNHTSVWRAVLHTVWSLQFKATTLVVVLTLSVTAAVSGFLLQSSGRVAREQHHEQVVNAAVMLARAAASIMASGDLDGLRALAIESANGLPLLYVIFADSEGRQLAVAQHRNLDILQWLRRDGGERAPVPGTPVVHPGTEEAPVFLDVTYPISLREAEGNAASPRRTRLLGYVRTGMVANAWHRSMSSTVDLMIGVGVLALIVAIPLGFLVIRRIVAPLDGLAEVMLQFSQGQLEVRSPVVRYDEIGRLASAFNQMADQHQRTHERIVRLNAELEERVARRTRQLRELASRDPLTGLYNRRYFNETLEQRYAEAVRYQTDLSCIMMDLDEFKAANDVFGHQVGDDLLILTARTLGRELRTADVAARYGGDEFVVLLPQTDGQQARVLSERIAERFAREADERCPGVRTSISVGIASLTATKAEDAESLVRFADRALYAAKAAGKNKLVTAG